MESANEGETSPVLFSVEGFMNDLRELHNVDEASTVLFCGIRYVVLQLE